MRVEAVAVLDVDESMETLRRDEDGETTHGRNEPSFSDAHTYLSSTLLFASCTTSATFSITSPTSRALFGSSISLVADTCSNAALTTR